MAITYTPHLKKRIGERKFPYDYPKKIYEEMEENYKDVLQNSYIAIKKLLYAGRIRKIMIAYTFDEDDVKIITIHPENNVEIKNRVENGRWIKV